MVSRQGVGRDSAVGEPILTEVTPEALDQLRNEVMRKIGRNLLLLQQMEGMLKFLVANSKMAGFESELPRIIEKSSEVISRRTMGQLVGEYLESHHSESNSAAPLGDDLHEGWISVCFSAGVDVGFIEKHGKALAEIVAERNELIHNFLPRMDSASPQGTCDADAWLECQREKVLPEFEHLRWMVDALQEGRRRLAEYLGSMEYELSRLRHSPLVVMLGDIAQQLGSNNGYVPLTTAGQLLRKHAPDEFTAMKKRYGHKTLKSLILAAEVFDVIEEATDRGGVRVMYRVKPQWSLDIGVAPEGHAGT